MIKTIVIIMLIMSHASHADQHPLIDITKLIPDVIIDIKYATTNNFTNQILYPCARCYLIEPVARALQLAADSFRQKGYRIKIWDGYRPRAIQYKLWDVVPTEKRIYVADPHKGSRHNRGCAVDLTLVDKQGNELDMGTGFDDFSAKAHRHYKDLSSQIVANRKLLEDILRNHGFIGLLHEWWHFDYQGWEKYPLLDIPLDKVMS